MKIDFASSWLFDRSLMIKELWDKWIVISDLNVNYSILKSYIKKQVDKDGIYPIFPRLVNNKGCIDQHFIAWVVSWYNAISFNIWLLEWVDHFEISEKQIHIILNYMRSCVSDIRAWFQGTWITIL